MNKFAAYFALEKEVNTVTKNTLSREELISQFTDGRKDSLRDLTDFEFKELLRWMKTAFKLPEKDWLNSPENKMRRKIIALFKKMEYTKPDGSADMNAIDTWCINYGRFHKPLQHHNKAQLIQLVSQVEKVYQSFTQTLNQ